MDRSVYLDYAATTRSIRASRTQCSLLHERFGNANSLYALGRDAARTLDDARSGGRRIGASQPDEVIFTSGGTESDNTAIIGLAPRWARSGH